MPLLCPLLRICRIRMERCEGGSPEMGRMSVRLAMYEPHDIPPACRVCFRALDSQGDERHDSRSREAAPIISTPEPKPEPNPEPCPGAMAGREASGRAAPPHGVR